MRFWRKRGDRVLVVGIFKSAGTGTAVLRNLHSARFRRAAAIHASAKGRQRLEEQGISAIGRSAAASVLGLTAGAFILWESGMLADYPRAGLALLLAACGLAGAITEWILVQLFREHLDAASLDRVTSTILPNETVVLAEVEASETSRVLAILRDVEAEAPVTFAFHSPPPFPFESTARPLGHELPSSQRLAEKAARLARPLPVSREAKPRGPSFLHRLREIEQALEWANASLTMSAEVHHAFTLSAEWLLDNAYLIREQVTDLRESLPQKYYGEAASHRQRPRGGVAAGLPGRSGNGGRERRRIGSGDHPEISGRFSGDHAAGHRRTLGSPADVAIAVARMSAHARDPGRATAKPERGGGFLGESAHHRRAAQFTAIAQDDGRTRGTVSRADAAFCERTGGASLRRRGGAPDGERLAGTLASRAAARGHAAGTSAPGGAADRARQCDQ